MLHYFYVVNRAWLLSDVRPALAESRRRGSFAPCAACCKELVARRPVPDDAVVRAIVAGLSYDRLLWHALIDELLILGADDMPRIPCMIDALCCLLAPERFGVERVDRAGLTPIEQAHFGARDLRFGGGWHRPEFVGWNDADEVARLFAFLQSIDSKTWSADALAPLTNLIDAVERAEELAYVCDCWSALVAMYEQAHAAQQVIICERT